MVLGEMLWNSLKVTYLVVNNMLHKMGFHRVLNIKCGVPQGINSGTAIISGVHKWYVIRLPRYCLLKIQICYIRILINLLLKIRSIMNKTCITMGKVNTLSLNVSKTHYIIFTRKPKTMTSLNIGNDNKIINEVDNTQFLGVIIEKSWPGWNIYHTYHRKLRRELEWLSKLKMTE